MAIVMLLTELATGRRRCRMCGSSTPHQGRWCGPDCRREWLDFYQPGH